jgi:hypothetical protein
MAKPKTELETDLEREPEAEQATAAKADDADPGVTDDGEGPAVKPKPAAKPKTAPKAKEDEKPAAPAAPRKGFLERFLDRYREENGYEA